LAERGARPFESSQGGLLKTALDDPSLLTGGFWEELRVFLAVAKAGSFAKASDMLGLSVPTVSRGVRRLQDQLQTQLVSVSRVGAALTPDGVELAKALSELDYRLFQIASGFRSRTRDIQGMVRISVTEGLAGVFVASHLTRFQHRYPSIAIHLRTPINVSDLRENQADVMVAFSPDQPDDIAVRPLGFLHLIPMAAQGYIDRHGIPDLTNLAQHHFVDSQFYAAKTGMWDGWHSLVRKGRVAAVCDSSLAYGMSVVSGLGIGLLGNYVLADPTVRTLDLGVHIKVPMYMIGLAERLEARPVRAILELLYEILGPTNPWFAESLTLVPSHGMSFVQTVSALRGEQPGNGVA
jgi:DNA-binding transcriptional LysR family regulator